MIKWSTLSLSRQKNDEGDDFEHSEKSFNAVDLLKKIKKLFYSNPSNRYGYLAMAVVEANHVVG